MGIIWVSRKLAKLQLLVRNPSFLYGRLFFPLNQSAMWPPEPQSPKPQKWKIYLRGPRKATRRQGTQRWKGKIGRTLIGHTPECEPDQHMVATANIAVAYTGGEGILSSFTHFLKKLYCSKNWGLKPLPREFLGLEF